MSFQSWVLFLLVSLAAVLTPGPAMLAILGHALARGGRSSLLVVLGNAFGAVLLIGGSVLGLSALLLAVPHGLLALKWAGAAYLLWLGLRALRRQTLAEATRTDGSFLRGLLIAFSNPKALLFFGAVLPQFVDPGRSLLPQFALMAVTFATLELAATSTVTLGAQALAPLLRRAPVLRGITRAGGLVLIGAAAVVALAPVHR
jgi:threonine/homoserine/homoserine lactone efflux protein